MQIGGRQSVTKDIEKKTIAESVWFAANIQRHRPALRRYLVRLSLAPDDAEDVEQEACLRVLEARRKEKIDNPKAYLFRTAYNLFVQNYRRARKSPIDPAADFNALSVKDMCAAIDDQLIARERLGALADAIDALPEKTRRIFIMRKVYGLSHRDIIVALGVPQRTVERHVSKGLQQCRDYLRARDHYWGSVEQPAKNTAPPPVRAGSSGDDA